MKYFYFFILMLFSVSYVNAQIVSNGDFESWTAGAPDNWTSEAGTTVEQEMTIVNGGANSVKFTVTTQTQSNTDFRQTINVEAGKTYDVSVWIYQADNEARARLYFDGYHGYSDPDTLNSWQEITYSYTASATETIEVGLRFYDISSNWTGAGSAIYADDFVATEASDPTLVLVDSPPSGSTIELSPDELNYDLQFAVTNFVVGEPGTPSQEDGYINWTIDVQGGGSHDDEDAYDTSITYPITTLSEGTNYDFRAELLDNTGNPLPTPVVYTLTLEVGTNTNVADIAALRADVTANGDGKYYTITGSVLVTHTDGFRNRHWVEDTNVSGIFIEDEDSKMTTYNAGDMVSGLKGRTFTSSGVLMFEPTSDDGIVQSTGNAVTPQVVTIATLNSNLDDYESELVSIQNVTFADGDGANTFSTGTNYDVSDGTNTLVKRTIFFSADYIGQTIPDTQLTSLTGLAGEFNGTSQIYARDLSDMSLSINDFEANTFKLYPNPTNTGYVTISSTSNEAVEVAVFDLLGKQVKNETLTNNTLNVSSFNTGVYIVRLTKNGASTTKKLVIN